LSKTLITSCEVPVFAGVPPSTAVSVRVMTGCLSLSSALCSTNSADTLPSHLILKSALQWNLAPRPEN
uniref:Uncharacterized protein n=1 Tax=Oryzias sinensis TaxID=183150 RepID=A0A8C8DHK9_9TELE